jgi:hypothetical protein
MATKAATFAILAMVAGMGLAGTAHAQDRRGTVNQPVIERFAGSRIADQGIKALDQVRFVTRTTAKGFEGPTLKGRRAWTVFQGPRGHSGFELFAYYRSAAAASGFKTLYTCSRATCPGTLFYAGMGGLQNETVMAMGSAGDGSIDDSHYLVASRPTLDGIEYIRIVVRGPALPVALVDLVRVAG